MSNLTHHFLIPSPTMSDERFGEALIYVCRHTKEGAWGFIINKPLPTPVGMILHDFSLPSPLSTMNTPLMHGGFVRPEAGFVLHTGLPNFTSSFVVGENVCLTTSKDILERISQEAIEHYLLCMGFCQWSGGQLEKEIRHGDWFGAPSDLKILFKTAFHMRLKDAKDSIGIRDTLVEHTGRA